MRISSKLQSAVIIIYASAMGAFCIHAVSPLLNSPRIGDKVTIYMPLDGTVICNDSTLLLDLTKLNTKRERNMQIWHPVSTDTCSAFTVSLGEEISNIVGEPGMYKLNAILKPGITKYYNIPVRYGIWDDLSNNEEYRAHGIITSVGSYTQTGQIRQSVFSGLKVLLPDDTNLVDVECVETSDEGCIVYNNTDTCLYTGVHRQWFTPGYRYPVASQHNVTLISLEGNVIDQKTEWRIIMPDVQEYEIRDDILNENLRALIKEHEQRSGYDLKPLAFDRNVSTSAIHIAEDNSQLNISRNPNDPTYQKMILFDLLGNVYLANKLTACDLQKTVDIRTLSPGVYMLCIISDIEPLTFKFTKL